MRRIYISGPITGDEGYMQHFAKAESELRSANYETINPARVNRPLPETLTHSEYMEVSIAMLGICDGIYMLSGWEESKGATIEFEYAFSRQLPIMFEGGDLWPNPDKQ